MKKLQLDLSELRVEAFEPASAAHTRHGTVHAHNIPQDPFGPAPTDTSEEFCYDGTCHDNTSWSRAASCIACISYAIACG